MFLPNMPSSDAYRDYGTMTSWRRLSRDIDLLRLDLSAKEHVAEIRKLPIPVLKDGVAAGVVQWMNVDLADGVAFSNHPDDYSDGGWLQVLHTFPQPIPVRAGEPLDVMVGHDRSSLIVMLVSGAQTRGTGPPEPGAKGGSIWDEPRQQSAQMTTPGEVLGCLKINLTGHFFSDWD